jgi:hypothetical protein
MITKVVRLQLLMAAAAISVGCNDVPQGQVQRCVDQDYKVTDDKNCDKQVYVPGHTYPYYRLYYGGRGYQPGDVVADGTLIHVGYWSTRSDGTLNTACSLDWRTRE